jgi:hypothetical protein
METLRKLLNEFAVLSLPTPDEDDTATDGLDQDEFSFSAGPEGGSTFDISAEDETGAGEEDEMGCECNCPSHKKFDAQGSMDLDGEEGLGSENIEVVDGKPEDEEGEEEFSLDDDEEKPEDEESKFNFF